MTQNRALMALAILAVVSACNDANAPTSTLRPYDLGESRRIDDAAHGGNNPYIFFLPPMVSKPSISATFHAGLRPRVEICQVDNASCTPFKSFSTSDVQVSLTDKHYHVNWDTKAPALDPAKTYRIEILLGDTRLGYADVDAVSNGSQLKSVDTQEFIALVDGRTLPIKFFLGQGVTCPDNSNGCAEYTVKAAEGGSFQSVDERSATVIPAGASPVEEFTLTIEKVSLEAGASCHGAPRAGGVMLLKEFNDCYHYKTEPDIFEAGGFKDPTPGDGQLTRSDRVVVAMCVDRAAAGPLGPFLQIFKSDPPPRPLYALDDAEEGVDFPFGLLNCEATVGAVSPAPGSGLLAHLGYGARRLAASLVGLVTPRPAYAIDLGEGGFMGAGDGYSDFRWGVAGHLHAESPLSQSVTTGSTANFSVALEAHSHHKGEEQQSLGIPGENIQLTIFGPTGAPSAGPVAVTNADGIATAQITFATAGEYQVTARHAKGGGGVVTFAVTVTVPAVIRVSGFTSPRSRLPLLTSAGGAVGGDLGTVRLVSGLTSTENFGPNGVVACTLEFRPFVQTVAAGSLVDAAGNRLVDVFFGSLTATTLTAAEAAELAAFVRAGGILHVAGNSLDNEGPAYNPLFAALNAGDSYAPTAAGGGNVSSDPPDTTPFTNGPFGAVGPLAHSIFRGITTSSLTSIATGSESTLTLLAEGSFGTGRISAAGDPLHVDLFTNVDQDNRTYFLNLFASACRSGN